MKLFRYLLIFTFLIGFGTLLFSAEVARTAVARKPGAVKIVKATLNKNAVIAAGTGLKGTIKLTAALPSPLSAMTCGDLSVLVGTYTTPPASPGTIAIRTFEEVASSAATGDITKGSCSYSVMGVPSAVKYDVLVNADRTKFACDVVTLNLKPATLQVTFKPGQMYTNDFQVTPGCEKVK